jgi:hypothetical protein
MKIKYDVELSNKSTILYVDMLRTNIWKLLPVYDYERHTLETYYDSLILEIIGVDRIVFESKYFIQLLANFESLLDTKDEKPRFRKQVLKCTEICKKIIEQLKEGEDIGV